MACIDSDPDHPAIFIVPTTQPTLDASADVGERSILIVGQGALFGSPSRVPVVSPTEFLGVCKEGKVIPVAISYTDQFVSTELAPILVRTNNVSQFFPSMELIASIKYGVPVHCWNGTGFSTSPPGLQETQMSVLRGLRDYYRACAEIRTGWLMRERQVQRTSGQRIEIARQRLRLYQSTVMLAAIDGDPSEMSLQALKQLSVLQANLINAGAG